MLEQNTGQIVSNSPEIIQFSYGIEQANTYLIIEDKHAVVIDTCSASVAAEITNRRLIPDYIFLTHEHVDHLWGLNAVRNMFPYVEVISQKECSVAIQNPKTNKASQYRIYAALRYGKDYRNTEAENRTYTCRPADVEFTDSYELLWRGHRILVLHTPGHSPGSCMIFLDDIIAFSGDTILNEEIFLKFDGGDEKQFSIITVPIINGIRDDTLILPGHGKLFVKRDWKKRYG